MRQAAPKRGHRVSSERDRSSWGTGRWLLALALAVGTLAALAASRGPARARPLIAAGCLAPMIIPNMVIALGLYFAFSRLGLVGTALGLVLAHSLLALPFAFIAVQAGLREIDPSLERAAAVLGARPFLAFRRVVAPLLRPFLATAALFAFIVSFDEIVVSLFLTSVSLRTLPKVMWENVTMFVDPTLSAASVVLILISSLLLVASQAFQRTSPATEARAAT